MYYYNICDEVIIISTLRLPICLSGTNLHEKLPYKENFHGLLKLFGLQLLILKVFGFFLLEVLSFECYNNAKLQ